MFAVKANSTGKSKPKLSLVRNMTECSTCPKVLQSSARKRDYERPQPIKIKHLLEQCESSKSTKKDSVRKKIQPERLGSFSSTQKSKRNEKQNGASTSTQPGYRNTSVQRHLNFNTVETPKNNYKNKNQSNGFTVGKPTCKELSECTNRKSLLVPPNTIKDKHLQKCTKKTNRCSKISEVSNEIRDEGTIDPAFKGHTEIVTVDNDLTFALHDKYLNGDINSVATQNNIGADGDPETIQFSNYSNSKFNNRSRTQYSDIPHTAMKSQSCSKSEFPKQIRDNKNQYILNTTNEKRKFAQPQEVNNYKSESCENLQVTEWAVSEGNMNTECGSSEMMWVSKDKILRLEHDFQRLLNEAEENIHKLRLASTCITRLLPAEDKGGPISNIGAKKKHIELRDKNNGMVDKEIQVKICCRATEYSEEKLNTPIIHVPQILVTNIDISNKNIAIQNNGDNKENENMDMIISDITDGSFLELENQLNIAHAKPIQEFCVQPKTPVITKYKQKRSFREYMALKSSISFLETPDGKKIKSLCQVDNVDKTGRNVTYISNKILAELHNLYSDSPES